MRKLFSLLLAITLIFLFTACGMTNNNPSGTGEDIKDSADNFMEDTKDKVDDFTDGMTDDNMNTPADMPDGTVDGTMENTEAGNATTPNSAPVQ